MATARERGLRFWGRAVAYPMAFVVLACGLTGCPSDDNNTPPVAANDTATTTFGTPVTIQALANDTDADNDTLTIAEVGTTANGTATIQGTTIVYTPSTGFVGSTTFLYTISDGSATATASVTVTVNNTGFQLTVLHNNDGESQLINAGAGLEEFGGVARFASVIANLRQEAADEESPVVLLSSGDNYLAGPEFNASLRRQGENRIPFFDTIALDRIGYTAFVIGNHEFDFGPDVLTEFIQGFTSTAPFLSANLDVSDEPALQALAQSGRIAPSTVATIAGRRIGIVGATTPRLPFISSPRNVVVDPDVASIVQAEVDALTAQGVQVIILISHLQSIEEDRALIPQLRNIDIAIAGGGDELLANEGDVLLPGDTAAPDLPYPLMVEDADGTAVPVITTSGDYRYVGRLIVDLNADGEVTAIDPRSGPVRIAGNTQADGVEPDATLQTAVVEPVQAAIATLDATIIGTSQVPLNGLRDAVRTEETNEGNLVADALLFQAAQLADAFGAPQPDVALQNGGGIRNATIIEAGEFSELDTFNILPFSNFVSIVPNISAQQFKEILENAVSRVEFTDGRFAQIAGFRFTWDPNGTPRTLDDAGNVTAAGTRVRDVVLNDNRVIVEDGVVVNNAPSLNIATIDFLANGGDQYPFQGAAFISVGVSYQQALSNYIQEELDGVITAARYPEGGSGRITRLP